MSFVWAFRRDYVTGIMQSLLSGLAHLHDMSIFHRDIKPSNILVFENKNAGSCSIQLTDFGLSRVADNRRKKKKKARYSILLTALWVLLV